MVVEDWEVTYEMSYQPSSAWRIINLALALWGSKTYGHYRFTSTMDGRKVAELVRGGRRSGRILMVELSTDTVVVKVLKSSWSSALRLNLFLFPNMAEVASNYLFLCLLFVLTLCSSEMPQPKEFEQKELKREQEQVFHLHHRDLLHNFHYKTTQHDTIYPPTTTFPTTPVTNSPDNNPTPTIVTVPSTNPASNPLTVPSTNPAPITNPVTTPGAVPGTQPITNPVTTYPAPSTGFPVTTPVTDPVTPTAMTGSPAVPGQSWCVARSGSPEASLQSGLDYACGIGGADCSVIQQGASCYNPNTVENHASYAFNSYYQKNPVQTSCDFGGTAIITNMNPSTGTCVYPSSSSPSPSPVIATNPTPTPTTTSSSGANIPGSVYPPAVMNTSNPASSGIPTVFGESPPSINSSTSVATTLQPVIGCIVLATSIVTGRLFILNM
ncbi:uncharacterized protein LOC130784623 isoform X2 [Actinidia eriantha]|nr:uncharacterized protein LOC130784623 isoform X2 [Actinidia eriantha]XP_057500538.1 uncharacterized protein LOC130784623 isoform X2 [Actinidia eriantha]XP_057500539.1 uncharacterized protein LOC130784623 isoform X2 [Actinidia eriantha]XP_057500540.1 uncharacterized protein LOC130784623 isoform X2 [Actinidia eriantha]XP_057500541.1 uncharacterized protein LOC130784623 isoform X2 [Actinidia eriantha]XP_057500542.1 uncharacterized protein LOC130784623 isoform X2 [Actinidia eriantha]XP_05750054